MPELFNTIDMYLKKHQVKHLCLCHKILIPKCVLFILNYQQIKTKQVVFIMNYC